MDLTQLRSFAAVARNGHFGRAAAELYVGQPAVSQHIRKLEAELGVELFARTTRSVELTEAGELLVPRVERSLAELEAGLAELDQLKGLVRGHLRIGAMQSLDPFDLPATLAAFHRRHPEIEFRVVEEATRDMVAGVLHERLDAAFVPVDAGLPAELSRERLFTDELVLIAAPGSALAERRRVRMGALREEAFVFLREGSGLRSAVEDAAHEEGFAPQIRFETNELARVVALVAEGLGVSVVSRTVAETASDSVAAVALQPALRRDVAMVWRTDRRQPPAAAEFLAHVRAGNAG
ncbi:MAG: LysR family transcriptional regulator [Solirubrobacteraceae bacterium]